MHERVLTEAEAGELDELMRQLRLGATGAASLTAASARELYRRAVDQVVRDGVLLETEQALLDRLRALLRLAPADADRLYAAAAQRRVREAVEWAARDETISAAEIAHIALMADGLGVAVRLDPPGDADDAAPGVP